MMWYFTDGRSLHAAAAHEHDGVLLEVVADARDVGRDLHLVRQLHAGDLAQRRVGLLGRHRPDLEADTTLLRRARGGHLPLAEAVPVLAHRGGLDLGLLGLAALAHELTDGRHGACLSLDDGLIAGLGASAPQPYLTLSGGCSVRSGARPTCSARARGTVWIWCRSCPARQTQTSRSSLSRDREVYQRASGPSTNGPGARSGRTTSRAARGPRAPRSRHPAPCDGDGPRGCAAAHRAIRPA